MHFPSHKNTENIDVGLLDGDSISSYEFVSFGLISSSLSIVEFFLKLLQIELECFHLKWTNLVSYCIGSNMAKL